MMKNYKGSKKEFTRYIQSEIDDDYLEPLESEDFLKNETAPPPKSEPRTCRCRDSQKCRHPNIYHHSSWNQTTIYSQFSKKYWDWSWPSIAKGSGPTKAKVIRKVGTHKLTDETMRTCISNLGTDAKNCYYGLQEFKIIKDRSILERFKDIYKTLQTINVLYLSVARAQGGSDKIEAVYLWQISEKCPCVKGEEKQPSILTDVKSTLTNTRYFPSLLLLAKITPEAGEEILEARILQDNKLLLQSKINASELVYKVFTVTSFEQSARVNPLQQNILANSLYTWKLKVYSSPAENENAAQLSFLKKSASEEEMGQTTPIVEKKLHEISYNTPTPSSLTFVACSRSGWTILLDKASSVFIVWKEDDIQVFSFTEMMGTIQIFEVIQESLCVLINTKGQVFTFDICELPSKIVQATPHLIPAFEIQLLEVWEASWGFPDEKSYLKPVDLIYFSEGKFYCVDIMGTKPATVLLDLQDQALPQDFTSWSFVGKTKQRALFYIKDDVLNIYDLEKLRHQTQKLLFENSQQTLRNWQIYAESPNALYVYTLGTAQILIREIKYNGKIDNFFKDEGAIQIQYFAGEGPVNGNKNIVQTETPSKVNSILLLRMKEPVYHDELHLINYDGPLNYVPPHISRALAETQEKRERCPYHKLVDRVKVIQKHLERYQDDEKCAEEADRIQKDIQELIQRRKDEKKEQHEKREEYLKKPYKPGVEIVYEPGEVDYRKYLKLYKKIKQVQKFLKAAKMRQSAHFKSDAIPHNELSL